jgi:hypothetical protein
VLVPAEELHHWSHVVAEAGRAQPHPRLNQRDELEISLRGEEFRDQARLPLKPG